MVADHLRLAPREIIFLADSEVDMATALAAGMYPAGALWGFRSERELVTAGASCTIHRPLDLLRLF
jgi:phosphoglycolate phosphatase